LIARRYPAGDLQVDRLIAGSMLRHQACENGFPFLGCVWTTQADGGQARIQSREMMRQAEQTSAENRDDLVDAIAENKTAIETETLACSGGRNFRRDTPVTWLAS